MPRDSVERQYASLTRPTLAARWQLEWSVNGRLALFSVTDVLLNCAMRDGLNLLPFEFVLTKASLRESSIASTGIVVLSEFVGCSHVLNGGVRVNPFNLEHVVEQLDTALSMPINERAARLAKDYKFVCDNTTATWLKVGRHTHRYMPSHAVTRRHTPPHAVPCRPMLSHLTQARGLSAQICRVLRPVKDKLEAARRLDDAALDRLAAVTLVLHSTQERP